MTGHNDGMSGGAMSGMPSMMKCDGSPTPERQGNWQGHVFPGTIFLIWGAHWFISASWRHIVAMRAGRPYQSRSTEGLLTMVPGLKGFNRYPVESILKAFGGLLLFILQITYGGYKTLVCPDGIRVGHFATQHINSWSHATMNLGYSLSGFVELLSAHSRFPSGTNMAFLSFGFFIEALLFTLHDKDSAVDSRVHFLLAQTCWAGAIFAALEAAYPENFLLSVGRIGSMLLQGSWFIQTARVLFEGITLWDDDHNNDAAPAMFLPVSYSFHMIFALAGMVTVYAGLEAIARRITPAATCAESGNPTYHGYETSRLLSEEDSLDGAKAIALGNMNSLRRN
ncbi:hypothetical protein Agub_g14650 [Astrephomene gubernaculifera]|uniref:Transmembrane protein 45B n=1 Tax=Astrephomene gubernaculifera TaxID=47775 RepID=A0AAD3E1U5_9CHLO|nr:hypothetical protein Agub_g14650 [Astrephomene gubernaculifera]